MSTAVWTSYIPLETRQLAAARSPATGVQPFTTSAPAFNVDYQSAIIPTPSCSDSPNVLKIAIQTTVTVPNYSRLYSTPIEYFQPTYQALDDGSLVTPVLTNEYKEAYAWMAVIGGLVMFFFFNILLSVNFIIRAKIKRKKLFYILLASQLLGLSGTLPDLLAHLYDITDCTAVGVVRKSSLLLSLSLLISAITGTKAYRCLNNSRLVLAIIVLMRTIIIVVAGLDIVQFRAVRKSTGGCRDVTGNGLLAIVTILQFVETLFLTLCFSCAVWKSSKSPVDQARLSLHPSFDGKESDSESGIQRKESEDTAPRRGWWDYVPEIQQYSSSTLEQVPQTSSRLFPRFWGWWESEEVPPSVAIQRKSSLPGDQPISQPPRVSIVSGGSGGPPRLSKTSFSIVRRAHDSVMVPSTSALRRLITRVPGVEAFRKMLKNELLYTACTTAVFFIFSIFMLVGVNMSVLLGSNAWLMLDWFIISLLTLHSFYRVVRRHEREALLHHPAAWDPAYRAEQEAAKAFQRERHARRAFSPVSVVSHWQSRRLRSMAGTVDELDLPVSESNSSPHERSPAPLSARSSRPSMLSLKAESVSPSASYPPTPSLAPGSVYRPSDWGSDVVVLPSPNFGEYSSSGLSTPHSDSRGMVSRQASSIVSLSPRRNSPRPYFDSRTVWEPSNRRGSL